MARPEHRPVNEVVKAKQKIAQAHKPSAGPVPWYAYAIVILFTLGMVGIMYYHVQIKEYFTIVKEIPVEVEIEKIKWVEHIKMPTEKFIEHLKPSLDPAVAEKIASAVDVYSKEYQLPKKLILSVIFKESSFDIFAKSSANAIGLMQVIPKYHQDKIDEMGITDKRKLYHINNNIELGCKVWKTYYDQSKGDLDETFHRYLSKNASEETKNKYKNGILETWARLEFMEFKYENGYGKDKKHVEKH
jgi:hypothetical protein